MASAPNRINHQRCRNRHCECAAVTMARMLRRKPVSGFRVIANAAWSTGGSLTLGVVCRAVRAVDGGFTLRVVTDANRGRPLLTTKQLAPDATLPASFQRQRRGGLSGDQCRRVSPARLSRQRPER